MATPGTFNTANTVYVIKCNNPDIDDNELNQIRKQFLANIDQGVLLLPVGFDLVTVEHDSDIGMRFLASEDNEVRL